MSDELKPVEWVGSSKKDYAKFPASVTNEMGHALFLAQKGSKADNAKPLTGFGGAGVLEIVETYDSDAYRAVYTIRFENAVYVLHCFQKKSKSGISTPKQDVDLVKVRLATAQESFNRWQIEKQKSEKK